MSQHKTKTVARTADPVTEIQSVLDAETVNVRATQLALGERAKLASDVLALYDLLTRRVDLASAKNEEEGAALIVMLTMLAGCRFQMTMAVLQNWRGRAAEVLAPLRRATELFGSACHVRRNPALVLVWLSANDSHEAYRKQRNAFTSKAIFPKGDSTMDRLFQVFDFASKTIHCSIYSFSGQVSGRSFRYFEIPIPTDPALIRVFFYIVGAHESILSAFIDSFAGSLKDNEAVKRGVHNFL